EIAEFFHALGILVLEGYGLTETSGAITVNRPERYRFGTVGPAIPGAELAIASDGEILVRGRTVMRGYHGGSGAAAIDADGWLHTGDLGVIDSGFLKITGRKKHLIITSTGKNVAPSRIEGRLRARPGIAEAVVSGDRRPYLVALISLDEPRLTELSRREGLGCESYADLARHPRIRRLVQEHIDAVNQELAPYERIKRFAVPHSPLTETAGELTPSQKIRRSAVLGRYRSLLDELYEQT
ncbi:MAG: AMP-binding protein, partial [Myxococcales bacterium]|nr:AMP-binding protein [Myxococcales bacterium]